MREPRAQVWAQPRREQAPVEGRPDPGNPLCRLAQVTKPRHLFPDLYDGAQTTFLTGSEMSGNLQCLAGSLYLEMPSLPAGSSDLCLKASRDRCPLGRHCRAEVTAQMPPGDARMLETERRWERDVPAGSCSPARCGQVDRGPGSSGLPIFSRNRDAYMKPGYSLPPENHSLWDSGPAYSGDDRLKPSLCSPPGGHRRREESGVASWL